ncbi:MAG: hypothetical protein WD749_03080 [Phycisphaerales bacterium]
MRSSATLGYAGCTPPGKVACTGVCTICTGTVVPIGACRPAADTCTISANLGTVNCGTPTGLGCVWAATPPAGEPFATPDACYCTGLAGTPTVGSCTAADCT